VLDAGCGRGGQSRRNIPEGAYVVGLDISADALALNTELDEAICADLQAARLQPNSFDIVICHDVLEHLDRPRDALENLAQTVSPGGELRIACPNVLSGKGLITKLTPHSFHVWVYRRLLGATHAGTAGHGPFPTPMRLAMAPHAIRRFARDRGFHVDLKFENAPAPPTLPRALRPIWRLLALKSEVRLTARRNCGGIEAAKQHASL
jgi:2-polyprenyl-3-methyl-5-hydroxy-6-metoxy-1,4-benzoquinol methylase